MEVLTPTTELDAVNSILESVGESPVDSLDGQFTDASIALKLLQRVSRQMQTRGWTFNTDFNVDLNPDNTGTIYVPQNTFRMLPIKRLPYVVRGNKVYDPTTQSFAFTEGFKANLVLYLSYDDLPEAARQFVFTRAGRRFQDRLGGDGTMYRILAADEQAAWAALLDYEAEIAQYNAFLSDPLIVRIKAERGYSTNQVAWDRG